MKRLQSKQTLETIDYSKFSSIFQEPLHNTEPGEMKVLRYNNNVFMNKSLRKTIMIRLRLKNKFNKNYFKESWDGCKHQKFLSKVTMSD